MRDSGIELMRAQYDSRSNLGYYSPFFRLDNCSHCVTIAPIGLDGGDFSDELTQPWLGSEIQESNLNVRDYLVRLLDDSQPLQRYFESDQLGEGFTDEQAAVCQGL